MIREATVEDFEGIAGLAGIFWQHTIFADEFEFDAKHCLIFVEMAYNSGILAVLEIDGVLQGFTAGVVSPSLGSPLCICGTELAWWVNPEHRSGKNGIAILKFTEGLAKKQGVHKWTMVSMQSSEPEKVNRMYERMGYTLTEMSYTKVL